MLQHAILPGYPVKGLDVIVRDNDVRDLRAALLQTLDAQILYAEKSDLLPKALLERVRAWCVQVLLPVP